MKQVLCNSKGALIARMPKPVAGDNEVLVQVHYSMVSVGTEIAPLRASREAAAQPLTLDKAREYSQLARTYLGAAIQDPRKAARRLAQIGGGVAREFMPKKVPSAPVQYKTMDQIAWVKCDAQKFENETNRISITTNASEATYQVISEPFAIMSGMTPIVKIKGRVLEGAVSIGLLTGDRSAWLGSRKFEEGLFEDDLIFDPGEKQELVLVVANCGWGRESRIELEQLSVEMAPPSEDGIPYSELDQQGWNVGYSASGRVVAVGRNVKDIAAGDLVSCGGAGKANHAAFVAVPRNLVCKVPPGCSLRDASSTTVGTIALQGVRRAAPELGEKILVIGLGLLGLLTVQMLRASGCEVIGFDLNGKRLEKARQLGLKDGSDKTDDLRAIVRDLSGGHGVDRSIITAATKSDAPLNMAMEMTRAKGRVVIVGDVGLKAERAHFYRKEIDLLMSTSYGPGRYDRNYEEKGQDYPYSYVRWTMNRNMEAYMSMIASGRLDLGALIERVVSLDAAPQAYRELAESDDPPLGVILEYPEELPSVAQGEEGGRIVIRGHRKGTAGAVNFALVGAGAFGLSMLVPQMQKRRDLYFLKGIVSKSGVQASNFARANQVEILASDLREVLRDPEIQMVVISTRHKDHASQVVESLKAGKHVFVEKPLALSWEELEEVHETYRSLETPPVLMVGFNRRFSPAIRQLAQALSNRRSPLLINYRLNGGYIPLDSWIQDEQGGGRNLGEACHMYDIFRFLAGAPVADIQASAIDPGTLPYLRNDNFCAALRYADGSVGNLVYTALGPKQGLPKERIEVFCDGEAYVLDDFKSLRKCSSDEVLWSSGETDKGHFTELSLLGEALLKGEEAPIPFDELIETTAVSLRVEDILRGTAHEL